jgi:hypothetical protein
LPNLLPAGAMGTVWRVGAHHLLAGDWLACSPSSSAPITGGPAGSAQSGRPFFSPRISRPVSEIVHSIVPGCRCFALVAIASVPATFPQPISTSTVRQQIWQLTHHDRFVARSRREFSAHNGHQRGSGISA